MYTIYIYCILIDIERCYYFISPMLHVWYIRQHLHHFCDPNVGKYSIHGAYDNMGIMYISINNCLVVSTPLKNIQSQLG
jgi:UPF0288 family protein (methanogenesis marker protein 3)